MKWMNWLGVFLAGLGAWLYIATAQESTLGLIAGLAVAGLGVFFMLKNWNK